MRAGVCYLALPMDTGDAAEWANEARQRLAAEGWFTYDPSSAWSAIARPTSEQARIVHEANVATIRKCDALLALLPADTRSFGVPIEVAIAVAAGKPVVLVGPGGLVTTALGVPTCGTVEQGVQALLSWEAL
jgi:nucleoside 2-deoxyribosyltransferase